MNRATATPRQFLVWRDLATYRGPGFASHRHSHFYVQICLPDSGQVQLLGRSGVVQSYKVACIPSGASHEMIPVHGNLTLIYLDPLTTGLGLFFGRGLPPDHAAFEMDDLMTGIMKKRIVDAVQRPGPRVRSEILRILEGCWVRSPQHKLDPRIEQSIAGADAEAFSLHRLASEANLSVSRFRHLFREQTDVAFSDYKLWLKVKKAVHHMAQNPDLASAAYGAGFADQAHFSRVFRRSFGMNPSEFTKRNFPFRVSFFADK